MVTQGRPLRADAERSVRAILEAAERVLAANPAASLEQVAEAAGVARTTVHRRFANRQALVDTLVTTVMDQLDAVIDAANPDTAPPLVALHQVTASVLRLKLGWPFAMTESFAPESKWAERQHHTAARCVTLLARAQSTGHIAPDADLAWTCKVYYALIGEAAHNTTEPDPDLLATKVINTLLHGAGPRP
ncbi:TetR/AcrR family transcriptional regulator [Actinokineospora cianjurensis]|uniref:TetR family transcriptional regulator n=1 Tax=Actinokineospora cianjurensis TaxID=585224 RepID=A0A421AZ38_9PSEU|nr:helix-turn-helix domain-containing protein [Actinokineospora cianjurensis]RLK55080.1 TetR family transcriptional regulator [Actinokineospora cianjurensis]